MDKSNINNLINNIKGELVTCYKMFHQNPELSNEEYKTTQMIKDILNEAGIEVLDTSLKTGLVARIEGKSKGPVVALRCDIDALKIDEETDLEYRSLNKGVMHACGHDFHIATMIGAALLLKEKQDELQGTVKIIFQPAEEDGHGAEDVIATGALNDVWTIFGVHTSTVLNVGEIGLTLNPPTAAVDHFMININGVGTHAAHPQKGVDPIIISAHIITALQTIITRNVSAFDSALISITNVHSGTTWNVIPSTAFIEGTVRTLDKDTRKLIEEKMRAISTSIATSFGGEAEFIWRQGPPATDNSPRWVEVAKNVAMKSALRVKTSPPSLGGEDFAYYQERIPGVFIHMGTGDAYPQHHPKFTVDTTALYGSAVYFKNLAIESLKKLNEEEGLYSGEGI
ncbi:amidohydrolase [Clostridium cylindrosporum]|uniref:Amidohydrolase n=1 Tax=Clostridium cylindrosporum DSM 605 TaxID=1121307 RepID=A0A0J8D970_CLOCY|nr:amidohydrolase [Clostridium cylindrosporum]KMT22412.1 amidohydrolase [Clostridium cylindrosporum DSM 605]